MTTLDGWVNLSIDGYRNEDLFTLHTVFLVFIQKCTFIRLMYLNSIHIDHFPIHLSGDLDPTIK
jgi:hypothetical protein